MNGLWAQYKHLGAAAGTHWVDVVLVCRLNDPTVLQQLFYLHLEGRMPDWSVKNPSLLRWLLNWQFFIFPPKEMPEGVDRNRTSG